jgi:acetyltransferase-like isoleucine patch superfamily enzyme
VFGYFYLVLKLCRNKKTQLLSLLQIQYLKSQGHQIGKNVVLGERVSISLCRDSSLKIGAEVKIDGDTNLIVGSKGILEIGDNTYIGRRNIISAMEKVSIGKDCMLAHNVSILDSSHEFRNSQISMINQGEKTEAVEISNDIWIGLGTAILKGTKLGPRTIVAANSVVGNKSPANSKGGVILGGNPAEIIKEI